jgi:hypothetical protein
MRKRKYHVAAVWSRVVRAQFDNNATNWLIYYAANTEAHLFW